MAVYSVMLVPAYGRDYKTKKAVKEAWDAGKDFRIADMSSPDDGRYTSKSDWEGKHVAIRYKGLTEVAVF